MADDPSGTLSIRRESRWTAAARAFKVYVDDQQVGTVDNGETASFTLAPGTYDVSVRVDFFRSRPMTVAIEPGTAVRLRTRAGGTVASLTSPRESLPLDYDGQAPPPPARIAAAPEPEAAAAPEEHQIGVELSQEVDRVEAAAELVSVPDGVSVTVKRSRTFEHTVEVSSTQLVEAGVTLGIKLVGGSIRGEISQQQRRAYQESETLEYEVELSGDGAREFKLVWVDVWRPGVAQLSQAGRTSLVPFRFRESTELEVVPIDAG